MGIEQTVCLAKIYIKRRYAKVRGATTDCDVDYTKWICLDCRWLGSRHETESNFIFSVLCPKCGSNKIEEVRDGE